MHPRRKIGFIFLVIIGVVLGLLIKNVKAGLIIGLMIGLLAGEARSLGQGPPTEPEVAAGPSS